MPSRWKNQEWSQLKARGLFHSFGTRTIINPGRGLKLQPLTSVLRIRERTSSPSGEFIQSTGNAWKMLQRIHRDLWKIFLSRHRRSINPCKYLRNIRATFSTFHFDSQHSYETVKICSRMCEWEVRNNFLNNFLSHVRFLFFNSIATIIKMKF